MKRSAPRELGIGLMRRLIDWVRAGFISLLRALPKVVTCWQTTI